MANVDKKDIIDKISSKVEDGDLKMELLEDITDSFEKQDETVSKKMYDDLKVENDLLSKKYADLQNKYISRFTEVQTPIQPKMIEEPIEEKKVIDIQSIFR